MVTSNEVKKNLKHGDAWLRVFFVVVFAFVYGVVNWLLTAVVLVQVFWSLITSNTSQRLRAFGASLGEFVRQIVRFMTYNSDDMPFPFADWPEAVKQEAVKPEPGKPKPAKSKAAKSKAVKSKAAKPKPVKPKPDQEK
jgi:hypothetical protein